MPPAFGPRRALWIEIESATSPRDGIDPHLHHLARFELYYRALVAVQFNFAQSGHPGGSLSCGAILTAATLGAMDYDLADPLREDQDLLCFAAGHKATGLYAMWALRDEVARIARPDLLPRSDAHRLRWEDLLGFRKNPTHPTPLFRGLGVKPLDGHPTPMTPFVRLATGPSGVGVGSAIGLAFAAADVFGREAPRVHILEGEGGLTPGRVTEAVASAGSSGLSNVICHLDWNQAAIDSDRVTREGNTPGEYVQWDPMEFFHLHDWNVIRVPDGHDFPQVITAQRRALELDNGQPTAIVYRTEKGRGYGITGRRSHGSGHKAGSPAYIDALRPLLGPLADGLPSTSAPDDATAVEAAHWETLLRVRALLEGDGPLLTGISERIEEARVRLAGRGRHPRPDAPDGARLFAHCTPSALPDGLRPDVGSHLPLRTQLGRVLGHLNRASGGAFLIGSADLLDSTAISEAARGFDPGYWHRDTNPGSRVLTTGGICEDGLSCILTGVSGFGRHVGAGASYGAFMSPLGHIAARVHAIGQQMRQSVDPGAYHPFLLVCGHAGLETGEDGPTHADPQALQLHLENYPPGVAATLTPWEPQEVWPLLTAALQARFAVIVPFVTRPPVRVPDREALGLAPAPTAEAGVYRLARRDSGQRADGAVVLQGSGVALAFVNEVLPRLREEGIDLEVIYVASPELFDRLPAEVRTDAFPESTARWAMGITGFTLPTLYRWVSSELGRRHTLHPFRTGHYLGSGSGERVLHEAGLDGEAQYRGVRSYLDALHRARG